MHGVRIFISITVCWMFVGHFYQAQQDGDKVLVVLVLGGYYHGWLADIK